MIGSSAFGAPARLALADEHAVYMRGGRAIALNGRIPR